MADEGKGQMGCDIVGWLAPGAERGKGRSVCVEERGWAVEVEVRLLKGKLDSLKRTSLEIIILPLERIKHLYPL